MVRNRVTTGSATGKSEATGRHTGENSSGQEETLIEGPPEESSMLRIHRPTRLIIRHMRSRDFDGFFAAETLGMVLT